MIFSPDTQYEDFMRHVHDKGVYKEDRTGTGTRSVFGYQMRFDLQKGFPLVTTKAVHLKSIVLELLWFLQGNTNATWLQERGCKIWNEWALPEDETRDVPLQGYDRAVIAAAREGITVKEMQHRLRTLDNEKPNGGSLWLDSIGIPNKETTVVRAKGDLGPVYGKQWRSWPTRNGGSVDQVQQVIDTLRTNPDSRRIIVSAWNVEQLDQMALMPCHAFFQFYSCEMSANERFVAFFTTKILSAPAYADWCDLNDTDMHRELDFYSVPRRKLSCQLYQRSADVFLGVPFNIASYALLTHMIAQQTDHAVGDFVWTGGDCHIYSNHMEQVKLQLTRTPFCFPTLVLKKAKDINSYNLEDVAVHDYLHHPAIKAPVAI